MGGGPAGQQHEQFNGIHKMIAFPIRSRRCIEHRRRCIEERSELAVTSNHRKTSSMAMADRLQNLGEASLTWRAIGDPQPP